jgi:hypothetical protein
MTKSQFDRLFREYPWLWALKQSWHHDEDIIEGRTATVETFNQDASRLQIYVYGCGVRTDDEQRWIREGRQALQKAIVIPGADKQLGAVVYNTAHTNFGPGLEHVVLVEPIPDTRNGLRVQVFRAPGATSFWGWLHRHYGWSEVTAPEEVTYGEQ